MSSSYFFKTINGRSTWGAPRRAALGAAVKLLMYCAIAVVMAAASAPGVRAEEGHIDLKGGIDQRKVIRPALYGDIVMNRKTAASEKTKPVVFKHWTHRMKYTCNVCHTDLAFPLKANTVDIAQSDIEAGRLCGACHDGKTAFGASECDRCHSPGGPEKKMNDVIAGFPRDGFGNTVDWVKSLADGKIKPETAAPGKKEDKPVKDLDIVIPVYKFAPHPPDVLFSHKAHTEQLNCSSCHPDIFVEKKEGNPDMNMMRIISGQYCGVCHDRVSFPLNDCFRCHSQPVHKSDDTKKDGKDAPRSR